jgi:hypothetical protein
LAAESLSEFLLVASVFGKGQIKGKLLKHLAPITLGKVQRAVPFGGNANFFEQSFVYILTPVVGGEEKSRKGFTAGEIAFMPAGGLLCFFLDKTKSYKPMNPLGEVQEGFDLLRSVKRGASIRIESISLSSAPT